MNAPDEWDAWQAFFGGEGPTSADHQQSPTDIETRRRNVRAATAYLIEYFASLPGQSRRVRKHARDAAYVLSERAFLFYGKDAGSEGDERGVQRRLNNPLVIARGKTIERWRRHYRTGSTDSAGPIFRSYAGKRPFETTGNASANWRAALAWWYEELMRNDY